MSDKTDLMVGFERGVNCAISFIKAKQKALSTEIAFLDFKLRHGHNITDCERASEQEKRHACTVSLKELNELHGSLKTLLDVGE